MLKNNDYLDTSEENLRGAVAIGCRKRESGGAIHSLRYYNTNPCHIEA